MIKTVLEYLNHAIECRPKKVAYADEQRSLIYSEFGKESKEIASRIILSLNTQDKKKNPMQPIVVFLDKTVDALISCMAVTYSGNIYVPFDVHAPIERLNKIICVIKPAMVLTNREYLEKAHQLDVKNIYCIEDFKETEILEEEIVEIEKRMIDTDPAYIVCTSGSTGIPKGVVIPHRAIIDFVEEASLVMEFSENEIFANQAPFYFDASVPDIYCTMKNMATLHIIPQRLFSFPIKVMEFMKTRNVNAVFWVPSALVLVANLKALGEIDMTTLKKIMFCGEVMPVKQLNIWRKYIPSAKYVNYYGPSETTYASTYYIIDREFRNEETLPIGKAALNTDILILNEEDMEATEKEIGELCIRGSSLALGYYNNPEKTKENFVQNPLQKAYPEIIYRTGDLVRRNQYNEIEFVCRKDYQIKHLGYRIELGEIETAANSIAQIFSACSFYDEKKKMIILFYEGNIDENTVRDIIKSKIPDYMVPGNIIQVKKIPMNANGKIDRVNIKIEFESMS